MCNRLQTRDEEGSREQRETNIDDDNQEEYDTPSDTEQSVTDVDQDEYAIVDSLYRRLHRSVDNINTYTHYFEYDLSQMQFDETAARRIMIDDRSTLERLLRSLDAYNNHLHQIVIEGFHLQDQLYAISGIEVTPY
jgi:hypothetical protein